MVTPAAAAQPSSAAPAGVGFRRRCHAISVTPLAAPSAVSSATSSADIALSSNANHRQPLRRADPLQQRVAAGVADAAADHPELPERGRQRAEERDAAGIPDRRVVAQAHGGQRVAVRPRARGGGSMPWPRRCRLPPASRPSSCCAMALTTSTCTNPVPAASGRGRFCSCSAAVGSLRAWAVPRVESAQCCAARAAWRRSTRRHWQVACMHVAAL